ncbi:redox-regulated ATPase YchF [Candidatus Pacearchaeota archaeon]|nr:redox-regulated ATPase YchF [Candidatus Pacearchaeota archaeon]
MLIGIVGKPNVGKSTFFKAATLAEVLIANYPFATIKPNHGVGYIKVDCIDKEFNTQCNPRSGFCINHQRFVPIELLDVAGLVPGAHEGKGLGNQFLDDLRQADCFIHIVDASGKTDVEGKPAENYDPSKDVIFLEEELDLWFLGIMKKAWYSLIRKLEIDQSQLHKQVADQFSGLKINEGMVKDVLRKLGYDAEHPSKWSEEQLYQFARELRMLSKPMILAANKVDTEKGKENYKMLKEKFPNLLVIPCAADSELALREAAKAQLIEYTPGERDFKIKKDLNDRQKEALNKIKTGVLDIFEEGTGVQTILNIAVFDFLKYIAIFPAGAHKLADKNGNILPDCFLLPENSTTLDFAYKIHQDLGDKFVKAIDARTKMAYGKDHKLKHRDALEIVTR